MRMFQCVSLSACMALLLVSATAANSAEQPNRVSPQESGNIEHGRYLTKITGCNDCHTPGYTQNAGKVEEKDWLIGDTLGWRGDWGTTYASNLRIYMKDLSESEWVEVAHTAEFLPPMPWFSLHDMTKQDLRALYSFIVRLGPAGVPAPPNLPPDQEPAGPYVLFPLLPK